MKNRIIILAALFILAGCAAGAMKDQVLIPMGDKIFLEIHEEKIRSYHITMDRHGQLQLLANAVFEEPGVQAVTFMPYQITVKISPLFKWEDVQPKVLKILKR